MLIEERCYFAKLGLDFWPLMLLVCVLDKSRTKQSKQKKISLFYRDIGPSALGRGCARVSARARRSARAPVAAPAAAGTAPARGRTPASRASPPRAPPPGPRRAPPRWARSARGGAPPSRRGHSIQLSSPLHRTLTHSANFTSSECQKSFTNISTYALWKNLRPLSTN